MKRDKKEQEISLHYSGTFEKNNTLSARTVANGLTNIQRIIDKAVMFARRGVLKKVMLYLRYGMKMLIYKSKILKRDA